MVNYIKLANQLLDMQDNDSPNGKINVSTINGVKVSCLENTREPIPYLMLNVFISTWYRNMTAFDYCESGDLNSLMSVLNGFDLETTDEHVCFILVTNL